MRGNGFMKFYDTVVLVGATSGRPQVAGHKWQAVLYRGTLRRRNALVITDTELKLIAALAIMGFSRRPNTG